MIQCYYAHFMGIYGTPQEDRDLRLLADLGFNVINPSDTAIQEALADYMKTEQVNYMDFFRSYIEMCHVFAFRALPDGTIPAGVAKEIEYAQEYGLTIIELPCGIHQRTMDVKATREYLANIGQR